ncbi:phosphotransferase family protein [Rhodococcus sp. NPDC056743]|uniref:phosphotransferase family protein n=1 Tax=Rhodococcus sp. NPDC056743 TaxID=3345934 RepID=UPI00366CC24A
MSSSAVSEAVGIDRSSVTAWIRSLGLDVVGTLNFERIGLGQSNLTFLVTDEAGHRWVLRRPPLGHLLASAHDVAREARILSALGDTVVPVPRVYGLTQDTRFTDATLLLMEFVDGLVVDRMPVAESLTPQRRREIGLALPKTLAQIHAVDVKQCGLDDLASHKPYAQRQLRRWSRQWEESKTRELPEFDSVTARLAAAVPEQHELSLVHGDFHIRNVITAQERGDVVAALDWELSTLGDPLADMGSMLAYWPEAGEDTAFDFAPTVLDGFPSRDELASTYINETGRDAAALKYWHALGLWKIAVIAEGVMRRAMDEPQNKAADGTPTVEQIDGLVRMATQVADEAGI